jgi:hypothetical protein
MPLGNNTPRSLTIKATVELEFRVPETLVGDLLDQQTGEVDATLLAQEITAHLGRYDTQYLRVTGTRYGW